MRKETIISQKAVSLILSLCLFFAACQLVPLQKSSSALPDGQVSFSVQIPKGSRTTFIFNCRTAEMFRVDSSDRLVFDLWVKGQIYDEYKKAGLPESQALHHSQQKTMVLLKEINVMLQKRCEQFVS